MGVSKSQPVPVNVVGSSIFGRFPKISVEKTYNMFQSDDWLINYAGFKKKLDFLPTGEGRALFHSIRGDFLIAVVSSTVYKLDGNIIPTFIGQINSAFGEVYVDENLSSQICIVDGDAAYIYNYTNNTFTKQTLMFLSQPIIPGYVCYHNSFFLIGSAKNSINSQNWYAFERDTDTAIKFDSQFEVQTKPDFALAIKRLPGRGNNVLVLGSSVGEVWTQVGGDKNYIRVQSFNIDNGVVSPGTIAASDEFIVWLAKNENNAPCIMVSDGASAQRISSDGIDFVLATIQFPEQSTAFMYRQDGHLFYQITFYNKADNLTLLRDFTTNLFFHVCDEKMNYHPARDVVYFQEESYFISLNDAGIYRMNNTLVTYDYSKDAGTLGEEIPRIRICKSIRKEDSSTFRAGQFTFWIEQGVSNVYYLKNLNQCNGLLLTQQGGKILTQQGGHMLSQQGSCSSLQPNVPRVDMSFSKNGNQSFSNIVGRELNTVGQYRNQIRWQQLGQANELTPQLRFWGFQRFVVSNGVMDVY
jgi:hypothetical protein